MPGKIEFQVLSTTGEDEDFRASELNYHGPTVRGWRSSVNCTFPQEIVLQLRVIAILHQIQILAHQYLIPQKIEICTSNRLDRDTLKRNNPRDLFEYLGFITFSDNKATGFRSRELKSIFIPSKQAKYVKLRIHNNHINIKNVYNQVSLMAINVLGEEILESSEDNEINNNSFHSSAAYHSTFTFDTNYFSPYDDLAFEMSVDEETAKIIKIIECKMLQAVFEERLDHANALNITIENLRAAGEILGVYEQEKRKAISAEDFDKAKAKKIQIYNFRQKIYSTLRIDRLLNETEFPDECNLNSNDGEKITLSNVSTPIRNSPRRYHFNGKTNESFENDNQTIPSKLFRPDPSTHSFQSFTTQTQTFPDSAPFANHTFSTLSSDPDLHKHLKHTRPTIPEDNREVEHARALSSASDSQTDESSLPESPDKQNKFSDKVVQRCNFSPPLEARRRNRLRTSVSEQKIRDKGTIHVKSSFEAYEDRMLPALKSYHGNEVVRECQLAFGQQRKSTLNEREKKQAMLPIAVFGIEMIEKFYSKSFFDKEEGLKQLQQELMKAVNNGEENGGTTFPSCNKLARAAIFLIHRGLRDTVYSVYKLAAETVRIFFAEFVPQRVSPSEVTRSVEKLLPELLTKSGDVTPRIHNMAAHTLLSMAECDEVRKLNIIPAHLSRPLTSSIHPRQALSRLEMVEQLILNHGISKDKKSGLTCRTLAEFGSSGLHHPAEAVRKVSERILIHVYKVNPRIVRKQLPPDDNVTRRNLLYRQLFQEFDVMDIERKLSEQAIDESVTTNEAKQPKQRSETMQKHKVAENLESEIVAQKSTAELRPGNKFLPKNINKGSSHKEKAPHKRQNQPEQTKSRQKESTIYNRAIRSSEEKDAPLKFPSLTDPDRTATVATLPTNLKTNSIQTAFKITETGSPSLSNSLTRKGTRNYQVSSIPVPIFGTSRRMPNTPPGRRSEKGKERENLKTVSKANEAMPQSKATHKTIKIKLFDVAEHGKPEHALKSVKENVTKEEKEMKESIKFSESMLASIRENEFAMSGLFSGEVDKEERLKTCIFCLSSSEWTNEDSLNKHYLKDCLMLTTCEYCTEVTEISGLTNHLLDDCKWKKIFQKCTQCQGAILRDLYDKHECAASGGKINKSRCPFCHTSIGQGETAWRRHLMGNNTCPHHPRQKESGL